MTLFVDRREEEKSERTDVHAPPLSPFLRNWVVPASNVVVTELSSGDVAHAGNGPNGKLLNIGYEIKHIGDFLQCMEDGRLAGVDGQLEKMAQEYQVRWLVIEDKIEPHEETGILMKRLVRIRRSSGKRGRGGKWNQAKMNAHMKNERDGDYWTPALFGAGRQVMYSSFVKFISQAAFRYGVMIWKSGSRNETAQFLAAQYRMWTEKEWEQHKTTRTFNFAQQGKRPMYMGEKDKFVARLVGSFPDVGYERGVAAARYFKTPDAFWHASEKELQQVPGIGKKLASMIVRVRREGK